MSTKLNKNYHVNSFRAKEGTIRQGTFTFAVMRKELPPFGPPCSCRIYTRGWHQQPHCISSLQPMDTSETVTDSVMKHATPPRNLAPQRQAGLSIRDEPGSVGNSRDWLLMLLWVINEVITHRVW
jgi:hypothetical protein